MQEAGFQKKTRGKTRVATGNPSKTIGFVRFAADAQKELSWFTETL